MSLGFLSDDPVYPRVGAESHGIQVRRENVVPAGLLEVPGRPQALRQAEVQFGVTVVDLLRSAIGLGGLGVLAGVGLGGRIGVKLLPLDSALIAQAGAVPRSERRTVLQVRGDGA